MNIPIRVIPNFLSLIECKKWINLINELEISRPSDFVIFNNDDSYRICLPFGEKDYGDSSTNLSLDLLLGRQTAARSLFLKIEALAEQEFGIDKLFTSIFWLAKQYPGSKIDLHEDTDGGIDPHLVVSSLVYLNSQKTGGELRFPKFEYSYTPRAGDLVMFETVSTGMHGVDVISEERYSLPVWMTKTEDFKL